MHLTTRAITVEEFNKLAITIQDGHIPITLTSAKETWALESDGKVMIVLARNAQAIDDGGDPGEASFVLVHGDECPSEMVALATIEMPDAKNWH